MTRTTTDRTSARGRTAAARRAAGFTAEEQAAMNARVRELKAEARAQRSSADAVPAYGPSPEIWNWLLIVPSAYQLSMMSAARPSVHR